MASIALQLAKNILIERILTKSTIDGVAAVATSIAVQQGVAADTSTLTPGSAEANVVAIALALLGIYRVFKKGAAK
jgi:hypothetical protein